MSPQWGIVSRGTEAKVQIKSLGNSLRHHQLAKAKAMIAESNISAIQGIPLGCTVKAELGVANPPESLKRSWEVTLNQCGLTLKRLLRDHPSSTFKHHKTEADKLAEELEDIVEDFEDTIPGIGKSVDDMVMDIRVQSDRIIATTSTQMKRTNQEDQIRPAKRPKNFKPPQRKARKQHPYDHHRPRGRNKILL